MQQVIDPDADINVVLVYSPGARATREFALTVPAGCTLVQAIELWKNTNPAHHAAQNNAPSQWGIWGKAAQPSQALKANDRIELYRALMVDPKTARRQRFKKQGSKGAGLFAERRSGGKAGY